MGQNYATMREQFWTGNTGRALRGHTDAQLLAMYVVTCPHANMIGLYHLSLAYIVSDTGMGMERVAAAFAKLAEPSIDFARYDSVTEVVYVPSMAREQVRNLGENDKRRILVQKQYEGMAGSPYGADWWTRYGRWWKLAEVGK